MVEDRYRIIQLVGSGGMSEVYSATDTRSGNTVALKFPSSNEEAVRLLRREFEALARINHENVVKLIDLGFFNHAEFLVMEYLEGENLGDALGGIPRTWESSRPLLLQLCDAIQAAHDAAVVHADLKPSNLFLSGNKGDSVLKLLDFGFAKFTDTRDGDTGRVPPDIIGGTIRYLSPEQIRVQGFNHLADIHAIGIVMYEMLGGVKPFDDRPGEPMAFMQVMDKIPIRLSELGIMILPSVEKIIMRALEKDPKARSQSAAEMKAAIESA